MLSLIRYYDSKLTDKQCHEIIQRNYEWNPISQCKIETESLTSKAIREVISSRLNEKQCEHMVNIWDTMIKPKNHFVSLKSRRWYRLRRSNGWLVTECGGNGDCFFHSTAVALGKSFTDIRLWTAETINESNVDRILRYYKDIYKVGNWNRDIILNLNDIHLRIDSLRKIITRQGGTYMGDDTTMRILSNNLTHKIGFIVFNMQGNLHYQCFINKYTERLIVLMYMPGHWQLIGQIIDGDPFERVQTTFDPFDLPDFLTEKLKEIGVNMIRDFKEWDPRLELEEKPKLETVPYLKLPESVGTTYNLSMEQDDKWYNEVECMLHDAVRESNSKDPD